MKHYHYEIHAYSRKALYPVGQISEKISKKEYQMGGVTTLDVIAQTTKEALEKAKMMIRKKGYRISKVYECHESERDPYLQQDIQMAQIEIQKKMLDLAKRNL